MKELTFVELKTSLHDIIKVERNFLEGFVLNNTSYRSLFDFLESYSFQDVKNIELLYNTKEYKEQSYIVHFETGTPVNVSVSVWHSEQPLLTKDEIISEAIAYLMDMKIYLSEYDVHVIEVEKLIPNI